MAYAAVISVKKTIERLCSTSCMPNLTASSETEAAYEAAYFFKEELERLDRLSSNREAFLALASQIREAAWKLEDMLELHELTPEDDEEVHGEILSFTEKAKKIMAECSKLEVIDDHSNEASTSTKSYDDGVNETLGTQTFSETFCLVGMAGIGKTTFALKIFEESKERGDYNVHVFVTVGQNYQLQGVLKDILSQTCFCDDLTDVEEVEELGSSLYKNLFSNSFQIVLDDVWDMRVLKELSRFLPENSRGSRVLLTTRREVVAKSIDLKNVYKMCFLSSEQSWDLFCANAFQKGESCPHELVEVGKKIVEYCEGLPLAIITVAKLLAEAEKTKEYWLKVANEETTIFAEAYEKMSPVLLSSYLYLPMYLKQFFIYLGVFPCKCLIHNYKIIMLFEVEEFLEVPHPSISYEDFAGSCLAQLASENVVIIDEESRTCRLYFAFWYLCVKEAERSKFYKVLKRRSDAFTDDIERERRLCIHNNVLFGIKDVYKLVTCISTVRSVHCTGSYRQYPMSIDFHMRLLKVLDAENIRFCNFPVQLLKLVRLKYLALTCSSKLPASISKLCHLQYLIIKEHLIVRHSHVPMYLPMEIWDMKELKHLEVGGAAYRNRMKMMLSWKTSQR